MAEFQPPDALLINNGGGSSSTGGGALGVVPSAAPETTTAKRQRKPSVRLGDIGADQSPYDIPPAPPRRSNKLPWKQPLKSSSNNNKIRPLLNLAGPHQTLAADDAANLDAVAIGSWKVRDSKNTKRSSKRVRSNWEEFDQFSGGEDDDNVDDDNNNNNNNNNNDNEFGDFDSESPLLNEGGGRFRRGNTREFVEGPSDTDGGRGWNERNGVRVWLNQLGLGRYAPVFEIHEVDDEVLPMLTLEDLKDMGISAVGSRRKMYSSIQKLGKGFS